MRIAAKGLFLLIFVLMMVSCKAIKTTAGNIKTRNVYAIVTAYNNNVAGANMMRGQFNVRVSGKGNLPAFNVSFRMLKDSAIWMSFSKFGLPVGKILIQPNRVRFYEKVNRRYFDGNFELISKWIGTDMNFNRVQNLFLGKALVDLDPDKLTVSVKDNFFQLKSKEKDSAFDMVFTIDPIDFQLREELFTLAPESKKLHIVYRYPNKKESLNLPLEFRIDALGKKEQTRIEVEYKRMDAVTRISFPFRIPDGYKEIQLK